MRNDYVALACAMLLLAAAAPAWAVCDASKPTLKPTDQYVVNDDAVYDSKTNLTWTRCSSGQKWQEGRGCAGPVKQMQWDDAKKLAHDGWRLPTLDELKTLLSPTCLAPAVNEEVFPGMRTGGGYWSSTAHGSALDEYAWVVFFDSGYSAYGNPDADYAVRLVKNGR